MVAAVPGDDVALVRHARATKIVVSGTDGRLVGVRPTGREEHAVEGAGRVSGQTLGELGRRRVGELVEGREEIEAPDLIGDGLGHLLPPVAERDAPQSADAVDQPVAVGVVNVNALALGHDRDAVAGDGLGVAEGVDVVGLVQGLEPLGRVVEVRAHHVASGLWARSLTLPRIPFYTKACPPRNALTAPPRAAATA